MSVAASLSPRDPSAGIPSETFHELPPAFTGQESGKCLVGNFWAFYAVVVDKATGARVLAVLWRREGLEGAFYLPTSLNFIEDVVARARRGSSMGEFRTPANVADNHSLIRQRP